MAKPAAVIKKPAAAAAVKPVALAKGKPAAVSKPAAAAKPAAAPKAVKPSKPFESGDIVIFKGYAPTKDAEGREVAVDTSDKLFAPEHELAVVGERTEEGRTFVAVVAVADYHKFVADENSVNGEEVMPVEVKRTNKKVEALYELALVGNMEAMLAEDSDPLAVAKSLFSRAAESFFYLGGVLAKVKKDRDEEGQPLYAGYTKEDGTVYGAGTENWDQFLKDNFGDDFGARKADYHISIYETFAALPNADELIAELPKVGWWKTGQIVNFITEDNASELVQIAQQQSSATLAETLKTQYTSEGGTNAKGKSATRTATVQKTTFGPYKLYEDQAEGVKMIIMAAAKQTGIQDPNQLFEHIVTEWAGDHLGEVAAKAKAKVEQTTAKLKKSGAKLPSDHPAADKGEAKAAAPAAKPAAKPLAKPAAAKA